MSDLISRQAAIEHLKKRLYETALNNVTEHPYYEEMADNRVSVWLKEVPSAQPEVRTEMSSANDTISRQAAIDEVINLWADKPFGNPALVEIKDCIEALPSAQPERTETHSCDCERTATHDLVSRQVVIDAVKQHMNNVSGGNDEYYIAHRHIIELLQIVPTAEPESHSEWYMHGYRDAQPRWIPCSEETGDGYPEEDGFYYVTEQNYGFYLDADYKQRVTHTSHFKNGDFTERFYTENNSNITAWMPLPEPYKGETE